MFQRNALIQNTVSGFYGGAVFINSGALLDVKGWVNRIVKVGGMRLGGFRSNGLAIASCM